MTPPVTHNEKEERIGIILLGITCIGLLLFPLIGVVFGAAYIAYVVYRHPQIGLYGIIALAPMIGLVVHGEWIQRQFGIGILPPTFIAPLVDIWIVFVLVVVGIRMLVRYLHGEEQTLVLPGVWMYLLFLISAVVSLVHLPLPEVSAGLKYMIRFPLFVYIGYIVLGMLLIETRSILYRCLQISVFIALIAAGQGLLSLLLNVSAFTGLYRAVPLGVFGIDIFNYAGDVRYGHILMAEHLTVAIPIAVYLAYHARKRAKIWYILASICLTLVSILTFSRAGWLTMCVQVVLFGVIFRTVIPWKRLTKYIPMTLAVLCVPFIYMVQSLGSQTVASSNEARIILTEIGWLQFLDRPITGQGVGRFIPILEDTEFFIRHFGVPVDAHSIVSKLLTEQGIFGLGTFVLFIGWIFKHTYKRAQDEGYTTDARMAATLALFLVITPLFFQLFNTQYYSARMWIPIMLALSLIFLYRTHSSRMNTHITFLSKRHLTPTIISDVFDKRV
jgi:O-antigen ligase